MTVTIIETPAIIHGIIAANFGPVPEGSMVSTLVCLVLFLLGMGALAILLDKFGKPDKPKRWEIDEDKRTCPHCKSIIAKSATACPNCTRDV